MSLFKQASVGTRSVVRPRAHGHTFRMHKPIPSIPASAGVLSRATGWPSCGAEALTAIASVTGGLEDTEPGFGARFNLTTCGGCHLQAAIGGTKPAINP
jgi:hypothetical protein